MKLSLEEKALFEPRMQFLIYVFYTPVNEGVFLSGFLERSFDFEKNMKTGINIMKCFDIYLRKIFEYK